MSVFTELRDLWAGWCFLLLSDIDQDGDLDFFDVSAFVLAFSLMGPEGDWDNEGDWDFFDVSGYSNAFAMRCP